MQTMAPWEDFRNSGMLWFANRVLSPFGWEILLVVDEQDRVLQVAPVRTKWLSRTATPDEDEKGRAAFLTHLEPPPSRVLDPKALPEDVQKCVERVEAMTVTSE